MQTTLPEKVSLVIEYMLLGHDLQVEGRKYVMYNDGKIYQLGMRTHIWIVGEFPNHDETETFCSTGVSFNHFLGIIQDLTDGDIARIRQIVKESA